MRWFEHILILLGILAITGVMGLIGVICFGICFTDGKPDFCYIEKDISQDIYFLKTHRPWRSDDVIFKSANIGDIKEYLHSDLCPREK